MVNTVMYFAWLVFLGLCLWFGLILLKVAGHSAAAQDRVVQVRGIDSYHQLPRPSRGIIRR